MKYRSILLFGAPGSGKGTHGKIIGQIPGFFHSSSGDIFRSLDLKSETGQKFTSYASKGLLVPDELTMQVWKEYMTSRDMANKFHPESQYLVLDGLPRTIRQAQLLQDLIQVDLIVYLHCSDLDKIIERLRRRALLENRFDDANDSVVRRRLETYERDTRPVLDFYPSELIATVDATQNQVRVLYEILQHLIPLKEKLDATVEAAGTR